MGLGKDSTLLWWRSAARNAPDALTEALFGILGRRVQDCRFLHLFAGAGRVGMEALNRGAERCSFVESANRQVKVLRANLKAASLLPQAEIIHFNVFDTISSLYNRQHHFDVIYADPPQEPRVVEATVAILDKYPLLRDEGFLFVHLPLRMTLPGGLKTLELDSRESFQDGALAVFRPKTAVQHVTETA